MIPARLIRCVPGETSAEVERWWEQFRRLHPRWELVTYRDPIDPSEFPLTAPYWGRCGSGAQLAGLLRLEALQSGGVYVDSDVEPLRPFDPLLCLKGFAAWEDTLCAPDAVMGFEEQHPAIAEMIALALARLEGGPWESGPGVSTEVLADRTDVLLLPPGAFYPYHYNEKYRRGEDFSSLPWCFAVHHWAHSWREVDNAATAAG